MSEPNTPLIIYRLNCALRREKPIYSLSSQCFMDDLRLLNGLRKQVPSEWESALRHLRDII